MIKNYQTKSNIVINAWFIFILLALGLTSNVKADCFNGTLDKQSDFSDCVKLSNSGHVNAQYLLGLMFSAGIGTTQDYKQAFEWFKKAAGKGNVDAQHNLGIMFYDGKGTTQDYVMAHMHWNVAASSGNEKAKEFRILVEKSMTSSQVEKAQELAREWVDKH